MAEGAETVLPDAYNLHKERPVVEASTYGFVQHCLSKNLPSTGILEFKVEGSSEHCIALDKVFFKVSIEISGEAVRPAPANAAEGTAPTRVSIGAAQNPAKVYPINNILHSLFESVEVDLEGQATTKTDKHNAYVAYINNLCSYGDNYHCKDFQLSGWSKDTKAKFESLTDTENTALAQRRLYFREESGKLKGEFIGRLCSPIFMQEKVLLPQVGMRVVLKKGSDAFALMCEAGSFSIKITDAALMVQKVALSDGVRETYARLLNEGNPVQYVLKTPTVNYYTIEKDSSQFMRDDLFSGKIPRQIIIGMVETSAYHGNPQQNPFNFQHFNVSEVGLYKDGMPYPYPIMKLDFQNKIYAEAFHNFMKCLGRANFYNVPPITMDEYANGYTLFGFDMSPDQTGTAEANAFFNSSSNIRLEMKFNRSLDKNVTLLVYSEMDNLLEIFKDRKISVTF